MAEITLGRVLVSVLLFAAMLFGSLAVSGLVLARLPVDYFEPEETPRVTRTTWRARIARNALGVVLVLAGIVMALPGVPGQGLLTVLVGLLLVDVPGKRRIERRLLRRRRVLDAVNRVRARLGAPPLKPPSPSRSPEG
jgi:hypothetical protein